MDSINNKTSGDTVYIPEIEEFIVRNFFRLNLRDSVKISDINDRFLIDFLPKIEPKKESTFLRYHDLELSFPDDQTDCPFPYSLRKDYTHTLNALGEFENAETTLGEIFILLGKGYSDEGGVLARTNIFFVHNAIGGEEMVVVEKGFPSGWIIRAYSIKYAPQFTRPRIFIRKNQLKINNEWMLQFKQTLVGWKPADWIVKPISKNSALVNICAEPKRKKSGWILKSHKTHYFGTEFVSIERKDDELWIDNRKVVLCHLNEEDRGTKDTETFHCFNEYRRSNPYKGRIYTTQFNVNFLEAFLAFPNLIPEIFFRNLTHYYELLFTGTEYGCWIDYYNSPEFSFRYYDLVNGKSDFYDLKYYDYRCPTRFSTASMLVFENELPPNYSVKT